MRGEDLQQPELFSYESLEERVPADHPLRPIRTMVDEALKALDGRFDAIYGEDGRKSIPPERLLRALLLQMFYTIRSERMLMEQLEYNLLFRWFVGLSANEPVWHPTVFTKNRDRLLEGAVAEEFFSVIVNQARQKRLLSDEHFTVDGTLVEAWAGQKSFRAALRTRPHPRAAAAIPRSIFTSRSVPTRRTSRRPILRHGYLRRREGRRPSSGIWGMW